MNRFGFKNGGRSVGDTSFQINPAFCADQSQLNELEFDLDDAFDELISHNDPFATPMPVTKTKLPSLDNLTSSLNITPFQSPLLPESSPKGISSTQPSNTLISDTPIPQTSNEQSTPDDFFRIRMRNSSGHAGIDLSSRSTARLWKTADKTITPEEFEAIVRSKLLFARPSASSHIESTPVPAITTQSDCPPVETPVVLAELDAISKDPETIQNTSMTERTSVKPKSISKSSKSSFSPSSTRTLVHAAKTFVNKKQEPKDMGRTTQAERRRSSGSLASIGGGLIDALVSYGEKIRNSLGLSSNTLPESDEPTKPGLLATDVEPLSPTSSSKVKAASVQVHDEESAMKVDEPPPTRTSKKRLLPVSPGRERKRKCIQDENANARRSKLVPSQDEKASSASKSDEKENTVKTVISRPRPLGVSRSINKASAHSVQGKIRSLGTKFGGRVNAPPKSARVVASKSVNVSVAGADPQPLFASDVYRQLAAQKAQKESEKQQVQFVRPPPPARPMLRPTIPAAFVFRSEERIAQRHDEKLQAESSEKEGHSVSSASSSKPPSATIRIAEGGTSGRKQPNSLLSADAPILNTMIRAKARERFDVERKEREKILELQRLIRERERMDREEREYRESRKRTIPRAHEVPEWYREAPHKHKFVE